jgi:hypothetical protein
MSVSLIQERCVLAMKPAVLLIRLIAMHGHIWKRKDCCVCRLQPTANAESVDQHGRGEEAQPC